MTKRMSFEEYRNLWFDYAKQYNYWHLMYLWPYSPDGPWTCSKQMALYRRRMDHVSRCMALSAPEKRMKIW